MRSLLRFLFRRLMLAVFNISAAPTGNDFLQRIRRLPLRAIGVRVGNNVQLSESLYILDGRRVRFDHGARVGSFCRIWDFSDVTIGKNILASHNLTIVAGTHNTTTLESIAGPVVIGDDCWIGANVTIVGPVQIGKNTIIGAGAVVVKDLPPDSICAGVPCKKIKSRL